MRCVKNALINFKKSIKISIKKSANKIYHEKIRQKCLSAVVPQLSAVLLRVRPPSCSSFSSCNSKKILNFVLKKVSRFSDS